MPLYIDQFLFIQKHNWTTLGVEWTNKILVTDIT